MIFKSHSKHSDDEAELQQAYGLILLSFTLVWNLYNTVSHQQSYFRFTI